MQTLHKIIDGTNDTTHQSWQSGELEMGIPPGAEIEDFSFPVPPVEEVIEIQDVLMAQQAMAEAYTPPPPEPPPEIAPEAPRIDGWTEPQIPEEELPVIQDEPEQQFHVEQPLDPGRDDVAIDTPIEEEPIPQPPDIEEPQAVVQQPAGAEEPQPENVWRSQDRDESNWRSQTGPTGHRRRIEQTRDLMRQGYSLAEIQTMPQDMPEQEPPPEEAPEQEAPSKEEEIEGMPRAEETTDSRTDGAIKRLAEDTHGMVWNGALYKEADGDIAARWSVAWWNSGNEQHDTADTTLTPITKPAADKFKAVYGVVNITSGGALDSISINATTDQNTIALAFTTAMSPVAGNNEREILGILDDTGILWSGNPCKVYPRFS